MDVRDKITVVTGAGSGIGRALAERLARDGARAVVCADMNGDTAAETARSLHGVGSAVTLDVSDEAAVNAMIEETERSQGGIDLLVSNAGYALPSVPELPTAQSERMMRAHTLSHLAAARPPLPGMFQGGDQLVHCVGAKGIPHFRAVERDPHRSHFHGAVIRDIGE